MFLLIVVIRRLSTTIMRWVVGDVRGENDVRRDCLEGRDGLVGRVVVLRLEARGQSGFWISDVEVVGRRWRGGSLCIVSCGISRIQVQG